MERESNFSVGVSEIKALLTRALGDDRLAAVDPDTPLLRSGIITSIELVSVQLEIERQFGESVLSGEIAPREISIRTIVAAVHGTSPRVAEARTASASKFWSVNRALVKRPLLALICILVFMFALDRGLGLSVRYVLPGAYDTFLEHGRRLYPYYGVFSQDDFRFAFAHHEVNTRPDPSRRLILMLGDSGTVGSYVRADEAIPAQTEAALERLGEHSRVANLAWYGRLLVKDVMMLELAWDLPIDTVVFTIGTDYFSTRRVNGWVKTSPHISVNWPLFDSFRKRIPKDHQVPFVAMEDRLRKADGAHFGALKRAEFSLFETTHYSPFLLYLLGNRPFAWLPEKGLPAQRQERFALRAGSGAMDDGFEPGDVDTIQIELLKEVIKELRRRGVAVLLYLEPRGPIEWMRTPRSSITGVTIANDIARETGVGTVDLTWVLHSEDFLDSEAHYRVEANRLLAERIAAALLSKKADHEP